jgi:hypothetical protein
MSYTGGKDMAAWEAEAKELREENLNLKRSKVALTSKVDQLEAQLSLGDSEG